MPVFKANIWNFFMLFFHKPYYKSLFVELSSHKNTGNPEKNCPHTKTPPLPEKKCRCTYLFCELTVIQFSIEATLSQETFMCSLFYYVAVIHNKNMVSIFDR